MWLRFEKDHSVFYRGGTGAIGGTGCGHSGEGWYGYTTYSAIHYIITKSFLFRIDF